MMRRFFGKKDEKKEEGEEVDEELPLEDVDEEIDEEVTEESVEEAPSVDEEPQEITEETPVEGGSTTMPYHATIQDRLKYMLTEGAPASTIEAPDEFKLELMAMGERFTIIKESMSEVKVSSGTAPDEDVFIRIGNDAVTDLLSAATFSEFSTLYMKYYKNAEPGKFVKIELRKPITELNRRGYARVTPLKLLIGAVR